MTTRGKPEEERLLGAVTGYGATRLPDGRIELAPIHVNEVEQMFDRQRAVNQLLECVNKFATGEFEALTKSTRTWWAKIIKDFSLSGEPWSYRDGCIVPPQKDEGESSELGEPSEKPSEPTS